MHFARPRVVGHARPGVLVEAGRLLEALLGRATDTGMTTMAYDDYVFDKSKQHSLCTAIAVAEVTDLIVVLHDAFVLTLHDYTDVLWERFL